MIVVPDNSNSIIVPIISTGCCKAEFDSTYPIRLNGIISRDEYRRSIANINRTIGSSIHAIIIGVIFTCCLILATVLFIISGTARTKFSIYRFSIFIGIACGILILGTIAISIGCWMIKTKRLNRMRRTIEKESMKYSIRSPIPCSWRLNVIRGWYAGYGYNNGNPGAMYHLIIDIGQNAGVQPNVISSQSVKYFSHQDNHFPPPYPGASAGLCSKCGMQRRDFTANICSSCGQLLNKHLE